MLRVEWTLDKPEVRALVLACCRHLREQAKLVKNPCIVLDIDDTVLLCRTTRIVRNEPLFLIYKYALSRGVKVFFVTARRASFPTRLWTMQQLALLGYGEYHGLNLMPRAFVAQGTASRYKWLARSELVRRGHTVLLNVGDQWSDLLVLPVPGRAPRECASPHQHYGIVSEGEPATLLVKLPNHRYVVP